MSLVWDAVTMGGSPKSDIDLSPLGWLWEECSGEVKVAVISLGGRPVDSRDLTRIACRFIKS